MFFEAASLRNEALAEAREQRRALLLDREVDSISKQFSRRREDAFQQSQRELELAYSDISGRMPVPELLFDEKFKLFNLKLKLEVLTRDSFAMPDSRLSTILEKIDDLEIVIDDAEQEYMAEIQSRFQTRSEQIRSRLEQKQKQLEHELELSLDTALNANRIKLSALLHRDREETAEMALAASSARSSMIQDFSSSLSGQPESPDPESFADLDTVRRRLEQEYLRRTKRKAPAVAEKESLSIIYNSPYPAAGAAADVSVRF
jgi:hypothetical protein